MRRAAWAASSQQPATAGDRRRDWIGRKGSWGLPRHVVLARQRNESGFGGLEESIDSLCSVHISCRDRHSSQSPARSLARARTHALTHSLTRRWYCSADADADSDAGADAGADACCSMAHSAVHPTQPTTRCTIVLLVPSLQRLGGSNWSTGQPSVYLPGYVTV